MNRKPNFGPHRPDPRFGAAGFAFLANPAQKPRRRDKSRLGYVYSTEVRVDSDSEARFLKKRNGAGGTLIEAFRFEPFEEPIPGPRLWGNPRW